MTLHHNEWWYARRNELMAVATTQCPVYIYNEESLNDVLFDLLALDAIDALFYPVHLNSHPKILRKVFEIGAGFQCSSSEELTSLFSRFPGINPETILFKPQVARTEDFELAFHYGSHILVHDMKVLQDRPEIFQHREIFLDLGATGGETENVQSMLQTLSSLEITVAGFHVAKNLPLSTAPNAWLPGLIEALGGFSKSTTLILGGERGVVLNHEKDTINIPATGEKLDALKETCPAGLTLWLEPGPQMVSGAGALLTRVVKSSDENGMYTARINMAADPSLSMEDTLMRTSSSIVNLSRMQEETSPLTRMAGQEVRGPAPMQEGDILLFTNRGTYGPERIFGKERQGVSEHYLNARKMCPVKI